MEVACQVREEVVVVRHPSPVGVAEVVGEPCLDRRAVVVVVAAVAFQVREEAVGVHQTLQVVVEEEEGVVGAGTGKMVGAGAQSYFGAEEEVGVEGEVEVEERRPVASGRMW